MQPAVSALLIQLEQRVVTQDAGHGPEAEQSRRTDRHLQFAKPPSDEAIPCRPRHVLVEQLVSPRRATSAAGLDSPVWCTHSSPGCHLMGTRRGEATGQSQGLQDAQEDAQYTSQVRQDSGYLLSGSQTTSMSLFRPTWRQWAGCQAELHSENPYLYLTIYDLIHTFTDSMQSPSLHMLQESDRLLCRALSGAHQVNGLGSATFVVTEAPAACGCLI